MSKELPVVVQYRMEDMGQIRCATAESFTPISGLLNNGGYCPWDALLLFGVRKMITPVWQERGCGLKCKD